MNKQIFLKIGLVLMPIIVMWSSGFAFVPIMFTLSPPTVTHPGTFVTIESAHQLPYFGSYVVLALSIYLSIKLWIKYIKE